MLDAESGNRYYLCYVKEAGATEEVGDGNKYQLATGTTGGQYFRVISQQTLPESTKVVKPASFADVTAASEAHARHTLTEITKSSNILTAAIGAALKSE